MKCKKCKERGVFQDPDYCKRHFIEYFENKVKNTITKFWLLKKSDKLVVAASGGKDSITTLYLMKKFHKHVDCLAIDEGIKGYRNNTLNDLKEFCKEHKIHLKIISFKQHFKKTLDQGIKRKTNPCTLCGTFRRYLLNKYSKRYDKIALGHNLDDEAQAIMMNLLKNQVSILKRQGPITDKQKGFTQRIKPLYLCTEKEVLAYSFLKGFNVRYIECPYAHYAFRGSVRDELNEYERKYKGTKLNIINHFLKIKPYLEPEKESLQYCKKCKEPSHDTVCMTCKLKKIIS